MHSRAFGGSGLVAGRDLACHQTRRKDSAPTSMNVARTTHERSRKPSPPSPSAGRFAPTRPGPAVAMNETSKTSKICGPLEFAILQGEDIDIGRGSDPFTPQARRFDLADGDANLITRHVQARFDFVCSAHCLEHMRDPRKTLLD